MTHDEMTEIAQAAGLQPTDSVKALCRAVAARQSERCSRLVWRARSDWMKHNDWTPHEPVMELLARIELDVRDAA